jgi:hypothetical protein
VIRRPLRIAARLRGAAHAHDAPLHRVTLRAVGLSRRGWWLGDAALLGLLDPVGGPAREAVAVPRRQWDALQTALNPPAAAERVQDKLAFAAACAHAGIPAPQPLAVLRRGPGDPGATAAAWAAGLAAVRAPAFVVKPAVGQRADGVRVLRPRGGDVVDGHGREWSWGALAADMLAEGWDTGLAQPLLAPHPDVRALGGSDALQTLRMITLTDDLGRPEVLYAALRITRPGAVVDNFRTGGATTGNLLARVEPGGRLATPLMEDPRGAGLLRVAHHPDTGVLLTGFAVPAWKECLALARRAAEAFAPLRAVGWDVAPTADGPVLVEGNAWWNASADPDGGLVPVRHALQRAVAGGWRAREVVPA